MISSRSKISNSWKEINDSNPFKIFSCEKLFVDLFETFKVLVLVLSKCKSHEVLQIFITLSFLFRIDSQIDYLQWLVGSDDGEYIEFNQNIPTSQINMATQVAYEIIITKVYSSTDLRYNLA